MTYETIILSKENDVGLIILNRPEALNALSGQLTRELSRAVEHFEDDDGIGAIVLTGSDKVFAAGADITEIKDKKFIDVYSEEFITASWERIAKARKPTIAAVSGHAVGGGFELAMMCDMIVAAKSAQFALPETQIGIIPGAGGTQRLTRVAGKALAMDMILTGRRLSAEEAREAGIVSRVVEDGTQVEVALEMGKKIAQTSRPIAMMAKEAVNKAHETHLAEGLHLERRLLYATFALDDRREGLTAFTQKRRPVFRNR